MLVFYSAKPAVQYFINNPSLAVVTCTGNANTGFSVAENRVFCHDSPAGGRDNMGVMRVLPRWCLPKGREQTDCAHCDFQPSALPVNSWCLPGTHVILNIPSLCCWWLLFVF